MRALCVDDEIYMLRMLQDAVDESEDIYMSYAFDNEIEALDCARNTRIDIAFLDIELTEMSGIMLAEELRKIHNNLPIIFCTGYMDYALDALKLHADGYLLKPISAREVQVEIDNIKRRFPNIDTSLIVKYSANGLNILNKNGLPLQLKRKKTADLLQLLIEKRGIPIQSDELNSVLFPDKKDDLAYFWKNLSDLRSTLKEEKIDDILAKQSCGYYIDTRHIKFINDSDK